MNRQSVARYEDRNGDTPLYSRIFVVCGKLQKDDLREPFSKFGNIEDIFLPKDRNTGEYKGIAYIKYSKTSSAAAAVQEMHLKSIHKDNKCLKVFIASSKSDVHEVNQDNLRRLFIKVLKTDTESDIRDYFANFGKIETVHILRHKDTSESKGCAFVKFSTFLESAKALEECDVKYKPLFATPKDEVKRPRNDFEPFYDIRNIQSSSSSFSDRDRLDNDMNYYNTKYPKCNMTDRNSDLNMKSDGFKSINVTCTPHIPRTCLQKLFNIVPGLQQFEYNEDIYNGFCKAVVSYEEETQAAHAVERLNNFEFPSGEIVLVKPQQNPISKVADDLNNLMDSLKNNLDSSNPQLLQLANVIAQASSMLLKGATSGAAERNVEHYETLNCSVPLPPPQPMANTKCKVAKRCYIVFKPHPPSLDVVTDAFSRFGDLINVCIFKGKLFGFAKYASVKAADDAIKTLDMATLDGIRLRVVEAEEKPSSDVEMEDQEIKNQPYSDRNTNRKRMRTDENDSR